MSKRTRRWLWVGGLAALALAAGVLINGCAALGRHADGARLARMQRSPEWHDGQFRNPQPLWNNMWGALRHSLDSAPHDAPDGPVPVLHSDGHQLRTPPASGLRVTWFGHSSTLLEIDGSRVLTDPIWSERPSPVPAVGPERWYAPPIALADLPAIDVVVISHDHYDHLDYATVRALAPGPAVFVVPLGIGAHLAYWGFPASRIIELDWWQSARVAGLTITATPARHASGRLNPDSDVTLWSGFVLASAHHRVYYSGDTGLFPALSDIGRRLGPFDVALIEAGQYDADWPDWHLGPEQAVRASRMVGARVLIPVHWGLFKLAHHGWTEPAERVLAAARCAGVSLMTPQPGASVEPSPTAARLPQRWWPATPWRDAGLDPIVATRNGVAAERVAPFTCASAGDASNASNADFLPHQ